MAKKRGRKSNISNTKKLKKISNLDNSFLNTHQSEDIIVHLNIDVSSINTVKDTEYSPDIHIPLRRDPPNVSNCEWIMTTSPIANPDFYNDALKPMEPFAEYPFPKNSEQPKTHRIHHKPSNISKFMNSDSQQNIQNTKNVIKCFWCCHSFSCESCYLPLYIKDNEFVVYGMFCSPECAASYNFNDVVNFGNAQERYSLLHSLYFDRYQGKKIKLAPSRLSLKIFGGNLSIDDFREISSRNKYDYSISVSPIRLTSLHHSLQYSDSTANNKMYNLQRNDYVPPSV